MNKIKSKKILVGILTIFLLTTTIPMISTNSTKGEENINSTTYTLTISVKGEGTITPYERGTYDFEKGSEIYLSAHANETYIFKKWEGSKNKKIDNIKIVMDGNKSVTAVFIPKLDITKPSTNQTLQSRVVECKWNLETYDFTHIEIRIDNQTWIKLGNTTSHLLYDISDGNHTIDVRLMDDRTELVRDSESFTYEKVEFYEHTSLWGLMTLLMAVVIIMGLGRLFYSINNKNTSNKGK